ncbi:helix-turn-helix transcriptional regulator [Vibrio pectenicida]|uniref:Helix-turn-helix transcriptional regulator n=1 Tax=Vibrio pectenicida TaxID=62763 RepID=A0A7Y3ZZG6_9VIBR|nr:helix-turn-helix transcriptional regulator [Vibrio pectenicida]NOH71950.1 helix-turn-helix transcriptional regulator [Vibrio pectenicida]
MKMTQGERIRTARNLSGLTRQHILDKYGLNTNTLQSWELERNKLSTKGAKKLAEVFENEGMKVSQEWLLYGEGLPPQTKFFEAEEDLFQASISEDEAIQNEINFFRKNNKNAIVKVVLDDSMEPTFQKQSYVGGILISTTDHELFVGKNCIIETSAGDTIIRRVHHAKKPSTYNLSSINPSTNSDVPIIYDATIMSIAPIIWYRTKLSSIL